ncbi:unnamed protein product [Darwinula stevensoni]|uniref:Kelch-like protein diablo n=1 Tax=Darwinula stevensoni TaxID=69355 RepID=A0A7R8XI03_9CRUS|nr:unnamed protein product [Darwinula stevensoni]CAG0892965.1 unnamed protein product [Darwinula stevensoni]
MSTCLRALMPGDRNAMMNDKMKQYEFVSQNHEGNILNGLNILRNRKKLVDVTFVVEGREFPAHKVVLASCSEYFEAMFTNEMKESKQNKIYLNGITADGLESVLEYAYTSRLLLTLANIMDVLGAASHVQVFTVVDACSTYLEDHLDLENCVDVATIAETYSLSHLKKVVYRFICNNLSKFSQMPDYQRLTFTQVDCLLNAEFPVDCSETDILAIVMDWIRYDPGKRLQYASLLLSHVRLQEILLFDLQLLLNSSSFRELVCLAPQVWEDLAYKCSCLPVDQPESYTGLVSTRGMESSIIVVGGFNVNGVTNAISYYMPSARAWYHLTTIPHVDQCNYGTACLDNELYVIGGCFNQILHENIHPFGFRYDPRYDKWSTIAPMLRERCRFSLSVLRGEIYAVGGVSESGDTLLEETARCEKYNPKADSWSLVAALPGHRTQHAGAAWKHFLFVSGGLDGDIPCASLLRYDSLEDRWEAKTSMLSPRADHSMEVYKNKLFVCGGWYEEETSGSRTVLSTIDAYDIATDTWEVVTRVPTPRYHSGITILDGKIYMTGGFHSDAIFDRASGAVEFYDLENNKWGTIEDYPHEIWEHTCVTFYVPKGKDDLAVPLA